MYLLVLGSVPVDCFPPAALHFGCRSKVYPHMSIFGTLGLTVLLFILSWDTGTVILIWCCTFQCINQCCSCNAISRSLECLYAQYFHTLVSLLLIFIVFEMPLILIKSELYRHADEGNVRRLPDTMSCYIVQRFNIDMGEFR